MGLTCLDMTQKFQAEVSRIKILLGLSLSLLGMREVKELGTIRRFFLREGDGDMADSTYTRYYGDYDNDTLYWSNSSTYVTLYMSFGQHRTNGSELARTLVHERLHFPDELGPTGGTRATADHVALDEHAKSNLRTWGLDGGGCSSVGGGFWGLILPSFTGC